MSERALEVAEQNYNEAWVDVRKYDEGEETKGWDAAAQRIVAYGREERERALEEAGTHFPLSWGPTRCICGWVDNEHEGEGPVTQWVAHIRALAQRETQANEIHPPNVTASHGAPAGVGPAPWEHIKWVTWMPYRR